MNTENINKNSGASKQLSCRTTFSCSELFSIVTTLSTGHSLASRMRSAAVMFLISFTLSVAGIGVYNYFAVYYIDGALVVHPSMDESDFCYDVLPVGTVKMHETVVSYLVKDSAVEAVVRERMERSGKQLCYCKRYFIDGEKPSNMYSARVSFVGPTTGTLSSGTFFIRQSRLLKILRSGGKNVLLNSKSIPMHISAAHENAARISPSDAAIVHYESRKDVWSPPTTHLPYRSFDLLDVPQFGKVDDIAFFNWSSTIHHVTWDEIICAKMNGYEDQIRYPFSCSTSTSRNKWNELEEELFSNNTEENDPFVSGFEVCAGYRPVMKDLLTRGIKEYNVELNTAWLAFPDYGFGIAFIVSLVAFLGHFFLLRP